MIYDHLVICVKESSRAERTDVACPVCSRPFNKSNVMDVSVGIDSPIDMDIDQPAIATSITTNESKVVRPVEQWITKHCDHSYCEDCINHIIPMTG